MNMIQQLLVYFVVLNIRTIYGSLCVTKVIVRVPKEHDIGLVFDLTVTNNNNNNKANKKEILEFIVKEDGTCTLNTTNGAQVKGASRIFGGNFGSIETGKSVTVSLIWPTVSLFNRVGYCPIALSSSSVKDAVADVQHLLYFDTRFETLDPGSHTLRRQRHFMDCNNWDKDYYNNCTPVNCEERYFGQRSFYNFHNEQCEPVEPCSAPNSYYDYYANECVNRNSFVTEDELLQLKLGKFDNNFLDLRSTVAFAAPNRNQQEPAKSKSDVKQGPRRECNSENKLSLIDFNNCFQHLQEQSNFLSTKKHEKKSVLNRFYYDWYLPLRADDEDIEDNNDVDNSEEDSARSSAAVFVWLGKSIIKWIFVLIEIVLIISSVIMFQIASTLITYFVICIFIFTIIHLVARVKSDPVTPEHLRRKLTPRDIESRHAILTKESAMSQR